MYNGCQSRSSVYRRQGLQPWAGESAISLSYGKKVSVGLRVYSDDRLTTIGGIELRPGASFPFTGE